jgi:UPF0176 protein
VTAAAAIVNLAGYKFAPLEELPALRTRLLECTQREALKGTILLGAEGINLCVAGGRAGVDALLRELRLIPGLADFAVKESLSAAQPFRRMLVKIKREIIAFGVAGIDPARRPAPRMEPEELKQWLDEGRPVTLLDTRNDYEVKVGTFRGAVAAGITRFRDFPAAAGALPAEFKSRPVVAFCTGGIRCEKAGPWLEAQGYTHVYQLEGGILRYFERCGGAHFEGNCFVFDERAGLDAALQGTAPAPEPTIAP